MRLGQIWNDSLKNPFLLGLILLTAFWFFTRRFILAVLTFVAFIIAWYVTYGGRKDEEK
ncbi:hypothetical protein [Pyrococcus yayanosii]|uniref:hypothetical protein n=1 Tax=Pyrococcus yayanosii TaxID=1008460 RepID=UPI000B2E2D2C|nr:hypothetical protein [Pyrococcus yayanosii]